MWFKNLQTYTLNSDFTLAPGALESKLSESPLHECPPLALQTKGWVPPAESVGLVENVDRHYLIAHGVEKKILPSTAVSRRTQERVLQWEKDYGRPAGKKRRAEIKDGVLTELLPQALAQTRISHLWIDAQAGRLIADTSSRSGADTLIESFMTSMEGVTVAIPAADTAIDSILSRWVRTDDLPHPFALGEDCEITGIVETRPTLKYTRFPLQNRELYEHLDQGFRVTRLALIWDRKVSFTVDQNLHIKHVKMLEIKEESDSDLTPEQRFEAEFTLMTGTCSALITDLFKAFGVVESRE